MQNFAKSCADFPHYQLQIEIKNQFVRILGASSYVKCVHFLYKPRDSIRGVDNSPPTRYVVYEFTCPRGHVNKRESMVFAGTPSDAVKAVLDQVIECSICESPLADKSEIRVSQNLAMPSLPSED